MLARCTAMTRYRRFHALARSFPEPYLTEALAGMPGHFALVAARPGGVIALASCRVTAADRAELALLVEDRWQRQGLGGHLLGRLVRHASDHGLSALQARVLAEQAWILRVLRRHGTCESAMSAGVFDVVLCPAARVSPAADSAG